MRSFMIDEQPTQPIPIVTLRRSQESPQQFYQRLKRIADSTGKRLLFVYLEEQKKSGHGRR